MRLAAVGFTLLLFPSTASASCLTEAADFADRICGEISNRGSSELITGSGQLSAQAKGLIARMFGQAQGDAKVDAATSSYENVAREELAKEHANARDCKMRMVEVGINQVCPENTERKDRSNIIGWLQPANEATPPDRCDDMVARLGIEREITVVLGGNVFFVTKRFLSANQNKFVPLSICGSPAISVERGPDGLRVDATVHDVTGQKLGNIVDNGYNIYGGNGSIVEHSGDLSVLVVHSKEGKELLYVQYANPHLIRLRGVFICREGQPPIIVDSEAIATTGNITTSSGGVIGPTRFAGPTCAGGDNRTGIAIGN